jgi:WD40 repeat protein
MPLTENTFLSAASAQKSVRLWDIRVPTQSCLLFKAAQYSEIKAIEKLDSEMFVTSALDGIINIWSTRMSKLLLNINVDESGVSSLKFVKNGGVLICGHVGGISYYSSRDYF